MCFTSVLSDDFHSNLSIGLMAKAYLALKSTFILLILMKKPRKLFFINEKQIGIMDDSLCIYILEFENVYL